MQIDLPTDTDPIVFDKAAAAGFGDDVAAYVAHLIVMDDPTTDPRGVLSETELRQSVAELEAADATIDAGQGHDARQALLKLGQKFGFQLPQ